jgi:hypothetical protein
MDYLVVILPVTTLAVHMEMAEARGLAELGRDCPNSGQRGVVTFDKPSIILLTSQGTRASDLPGCLSWESSPHNGYPFNRSGQYAYVNSPPSEKRRRTNVTDSPY